MILKTEEISFSYRSQPVLKDVSIAIDPGVTAIVGPNASGKSTLLRCLCGILKPAGDVLLDDRSLHTYGETERSKIISYLPQSLATRAVLTVFEVVLLGRLHRLGWSVSHEDTRQVEVLLDEFGIADLSERYITELSGGQQQLVAIAQAVAREPRILLLDEPNTNLDLRRQFEICARIRQFTAARGIGTALTVHDVNMAAHIADVVYVLEDGRIRCFGPPSDVLTEDLVSSVYGVSVRVSHDEEGRLLITPIGLQHETARNTAGKETDA